MELAQSEGSELASREGANVPTPGPPAASTTVNRLEANEAQRVSPTRRKLSDEQEGELTRLYAGTTMPVSEIARTFGIGESSVYRVAQRHGAAMRGRQTPPGAPPAKPAVAGAPARARARGAREPAATVETAPTGVSGEARVPVRARTLGRFRIRFLAERVVQAGDIQDALGQAQSLGAIEVTAVMRED